MEGSEVEFTAGACNTSPSALSSATPAHAPARRLREIMLDLMYRLPDEGQGGKYVITEEVVDGKRKSLRDQARNNAAKRIGVDSPQSSQHPAAFAIMPGFSSAPRQVIFRLAHVDD